MTYKCGGGGTLPPFFCLKEENESMFAEFLVKNEFYKQYMQLYATRSAIGNLEMEHLKAEVALPARTVEMYNNMKAFMNIIEKHPDKISPYDVVDIAETVNKDIVYFDKGYRKTQVQVKLAKNFFPIPAKDVPMKMYTIFDSYHNIWNELPVFEKEARLHIELVRLQPFEDGNKRTARILTSYNLCCQNKAPIIISGDETDQYFSYIDNYDVDRFAEFLESKSKEELEVMIELYRRVCGDEFSTVDYSEFTSAADMGLLQVATEQGIQKKKEYK